MYSRDNFKQKEKNYELAKNIKKKERTFNKYIKKLIQRIGQTKCLKK